MESRLCRFIVSVAFIVFSPCIQAENHPAEVPVPSEEDIRTRLKEMPCIVDAHYSTLVKDRIEDYVIQHRDIGAMILGRSAVYFPVFEQILKENGLPTDLKYLAVIESTLNPKATSRVGAGGLWQFMPHTAGTYGVRIDKVMDERADMYKSTEAAAKHLKKLYTLYNDWELVLAAYNSGTGKVAEAMRVAGSKRWDRIANYLPAETRKFIPRYIAAAYLFHYYPDHNLVPQYPDLDLQLTTGIRVNQYLTLPQVATVTGLPLATVKTLNPSYLQDYIPASTDGYWLVLPSRATGKMDAFLQSPDTKNLPKTIPLTEDDPEASPYIETVYKVMADDNLEKIAEWIHCAPYHIRLWNRLSGHTLHKDQELVIFVSGAGRKQQIAARAVEAVLTLPTMGVRSKAISPQTPESEPLTLLPASLQKVDYTYHLIRPGESLWDLAQQYEGLTVRGILSLNGLDSKSRINAGSLVRIKRIVEEEQPTLVAQQ